MGIQVSKFVLVAATASSSTGGSGASIALLDGMRRDGKDLATIRKWLAVFCRRFFGFSQFKRSAMPNGPKVSMGGALSPRGDWRARPSPARPI